MFTITFIWNIVLFLNCTYTVNKSYLHVCNNFIITSTSSFKCSHKTINPTNPGFALSTQKKNPPPPFSPPPPPRVLQDPTWSWECRSHTDSTCWSWLPLGFVGSHQHLMNTSLCAFEILRNNLMKTKKPTCAVSSGESFLSFICHFVGC